MTTDQTGYCTVADVRRVLQETDRAFDSGALGDTNARITVDAIAGLRSWIDTKTARHWFVPGGLEAGEDDEGVIPTSAQARDDEHDIPTSGATVHGADEEPFRINRNSDALLESGRRSQQKRRKVDLKDRIRLAFGDGEDDSIPAYARIRFNRKDIQSVNELFVVDADGAFVDWTTEKAGGVGASFRGDDWWVQVNNRGVSELYLDTHAMDDDLASLSNAVYVDFEYGHEGLPMTVRRGVAHLVAAELIIDDEFTASLPDNGQLVNVETKAERWERRGRELLSEHWVEDPGQITAVEESPADV